MEGNHNGRITPLLGDVVEGVQHALGERYGSCSPHTVSISGPVDIDLVVLPLLLPNGLNDDPQ